jgi:hypothetical protein
MASKRKSSKSSHSDKVGSDPKATEKVGGKLDFGVPESNRRDRDYVSRETKLNDPGASTERSDADTDTRDTGVASNKSGPGAGSGGDIDTDIVGVGFGGSGVAQSGPDRTEGADMVERGGSDAFAAPGPKGHPEKEPARRQRVKGTTIDRSGGDLSTTGGGQDAGSATNPPARNDDSFAADIQMDEAMGGDNSPSDNQ